MVVVPENKGFLAADDAGVFEFGSDAASGVCGPKQTERLGRRCGRHQEGPGQPSCGCDDADQNQPDELSHNEVSLDDEGAGLVLTMVIRLLDCSGGIHG